MNEYVICLKKYILYMKSILVNIYFTDIHVVIFM